MDKTVLEQGGREKKKKITAIEEVWQIKREATNRQKKRAGGKKHALKKNSGEIIPEWL